MVEDLLQGIAVDAIIEKNRKYHARCQQAESLVAQYRARYIAMCNSIENLRTRVSENDPDMHELMGATLHPPGEIPWKSQVDLVRGNAVVVYDGRVVDEMTRDELVDVVRSLAVERDAWRSEKRRDIETIASMKKQIRISREERRERDRVLASNVAKEVVSALSAREHWKEMQARKMERIALKEREAKGGL